MEPAECTLIIWSPQSACPQGGRAPPLPFLGEANHFEGYTSGSNCECVLGAVGGVQLSAEGHDYRVMHNWIRNRFQLRVCQLLVTFPRKQGLNSSASVLTGAWERLTGNLYRKDVEHLGFQLDSCVGGQEGGPDRCLFYSLKFCAS